MKFSKEKIEKHMEWGQQSAKPKRQFKAWCPFDLNGEGNAWVGWTQRLRREVIDELNSKYEGWRGDGLVVKKVLVIEE